MASDAEPVLPVTAYKSDEDSKSVALCLCGGAGAVLVCIAYVIAPVCFVASGVVFLVEEYSSIPGCAHEYKVWCIVMTVLLGMTVLQSGQSSGAADMAKLILSDVSGVAVMIFAAVFSIPAFVGYYKVVKKVPDGCNTDSMGKLDVWTWYVIGYYAVLSGLLVLVSMLRCCDSCERTR